MYWGGIVWDLGWVNFVNTHRDITLMLKNWFQCSILTIYFINFLQTLNESRYKDLGVLWDCKSFNLSKKLQSYGH